MSSILIGATDCCDECEDSYSSTVLVGGQILQGDVAPTAPPPLPLWPYIYNDRVSGIQYFWNTVTKHGSNL